jgi:phage/plasmid-like protein (TIGR03299 family)
MSHHLNSFADGTYRFCYTGDIAWHGLGRKWNTAPTVEKAIEDLVRADHMLRDVFDCDNRLIPEIREVFLPDAKANGDFIYDDEGKLSGTRCGIVGTDYKILQDRDVLELARSFVDSGTAEIHTAGAIFGGAQFWVLLKVKADPIDIVKGDAVEQYILMVNGHDGKIAFKALPTNIRVVCNNTLAIALRSALNNLFRAKHVGNIHLKAAECRDAVAEIQGLFRDEAEKFKHIAKHNVPSQKHAISYFQQVLGKKVNTEVEVNLESKQSLGTLMRLFDHEDVGIDIPGVRGTWWALYNCVSSFTTYMKGRNDDNRLHAMVNGSGRAMLANALELSIKGADGQLALN